MNQNAKEQFAKRVIGRLSDFTENQKMCIKTAICEELDDYVVYSPEEAAEIIREPLQMLEKFLETKKYEGLSRNTIYSYKLIVTHFIGSTIKQMNDINHEDIREYLNKKVINGASLPYANTIRAGLSSFFSWLVIEEYIDRNPINKVKKIKYEREIKPAFDEVEIDALRRAAGENKRNLALIDFFLSTGCRVSEVCNVNISDVNFNSKKLYVIGKGSKKRIVYLTDVAICTLKDYLTNRTDNNDALFVNDKAPYNRMTSRGIQVALKRIGEIGHVSGVHPHRFRHTCCTRLLCRGMQLQDVSKILGHANVNTTMWYNNTSDDYVDIRFRQHSF